jgi:hypothetical protein
MTAREPPGDPWVKPLTIARKSPATEAVDPARRPGKKRPRASSPRRGCRHAKFQEEADRILAEAFFLAYRSRAIYPNGPPERYVRALFAMANDVVVRRKIAWLIEQRSHFWARPADIILHCLNVTAWCIAERRGATKLQEVEEWQRALIEAAALARAEAEAAAALGYRDHALGLRLGAADLETLPASRYELGDPTLVTYRSCDINSAEALARGALCTLVLSLVYMYGRRGRSPLVGVAVAFVSAAAGVKLLTRDQARRALPSWRLKTRPGIDRPAPRHRRSAGLQTPR